MRKRLYVTTCYSCRILMKLEFPQQIFEKMLEREVSLKFSPVGAEFFHADERTDIHDEANSRFTKF